MTGGEDGRGTPGEQDPVHEDEAGPRADATSRLRAQLTLLRVQVRRLQDALQQAENLRAAAQDRLSSLRGTAERLEHALRTEEGVEVGGMEADSGAPPAAAGEPPAWRLLADAAERPVEFTVALTLADRHVHALLASGVLSLTDVDRPAAVGRVVQTLIDRWSEQYRDRSGNFAAAKARHPDDPIAEARSAGSPSPATTAPTLPGAGAWSCDRGDAEDDVFAGPSAARRPRPVPARDPADHPSTNGRLAERAGDRPDDRGNRDNIVWLERRRPDRSVAPGRADIPPEGASVVVIADAETFGSRPPARPAAQAVEGVKGERRPDPCEADQLFGGERLTKRPDGQREVPARGKVLQEPDGGEGDAPGAVDEQDQW
jgi:hypothetical protein